MFVSHQHKLVAVSVPKTGSTTLHYALMNNLSNPFHTQSKAPAIYHMTANDVRMIMGREVFDTYYSFGVVRNPYDRLVSLYHDFHDQRGVIRAPTFRNFVRFGLRSWMEDVHFRPQAFFLCDGQGDRVPTEIHRFEDGVENILAQIGKRYGFTPKQIGHARRSDRKPWQTYFKRADLRSIVWELYAEDFETFGYPADVDVSWF